MPLGMLSIPCSTVHNRTWPFSDSNLHSTVTAHTASASSITPLSTSSSHVRAQPSQIALDHEHLQATKDSSTVAASTVSQSSSTLLSTRSSHVRAQPSQKALTTSTSRLLKTAALSLHAPSQSAAPCCSAQAAASFWRTHHLK
eukprot:1155006-Pelagomonas_calceolata.AAC.4